jgi:hypothetical protein
MYTPLKSKQWGNKFWRSRSPLARVLVLDNAFQMSIRFEKWLPRLDSPWHRPLKGGINFFNGKLITVRLLAARLF